VRVLHCTLDYAPRAAGGAEHQARLQAEELARRGHDVQVACPRQGNEASGQVGSVSVHRLWRINRRPFQTITAGLSLGWFLLRNTRRFDVIHVHLADSRTHVAALACALFHKPLYVKIAAGGPRGDVGKMRRFARLTRYYGLRRAACVQATSAEIYSQIADLGIPPARIATIPNGFDPAIYHPASDSERAELRRDLGLPQHRPIVLYVGRFARYKGIDILLSVWPEIRDRFNAECVLVGFAAFEDPYEIPRGLSGVTVREWTSNPAPYYRAADVFVHPSSVEGMPNALLEAMACGLPAVATHVGATPEMIANESLGIVIPPGDPGALAEAVAGLLANEARRAIGGRASESVAGRFTLSVVIDQVEARYAAITSR
jgi:glycosyltransferase involved in cell wall biosynthesis